MALLLETTAVHRPERGVVRVTGPDRLTYLHTLLSQYVEGARPGTVADFLYLDAKGNPLAEGRLIVRSEEVWLVVAPAVAADLAAALQKFTFLLQVEAADVTGDLVVASVRGPGSVQAPGARGEPMTAAPHGDGVVVRDRSGGVDAVGPPAWVDDWCARLDLPVADGADWETWRIAAGVPGWGSEIAAGARAQELGLLPTHVHLRKGCYPGQESIAKIYNLGRPRRALAVVDFDAPVVAGAAVNAGGKAGRVTSAAPLRDGAVALVIVPLDRDGELPDTVGADGVAGMVRQRVGAGLPQPGA